VIDNNEMDVDASLPSDDPVSRDWRDMWYQVFEALAEEE
jgi:hypothetical protein